MRDALDYLAQSGRILRAPGCRPRVGGIDAARERTANQPQTVAVVLPQHDADLASREMLRGIGKVLRSQETPYRMLIFDTNQKGRPCTDQEDEACAAVEHENVAGAIVWPMLQRALMARWQRLFQNGRPIVFVDRFDPDMPCDFVGADNYMSAYSAVEHLLSLGHTRIAHLTSSEEASVVRQRAEGYRAAMEDAGFGDEVKIWALPPAYPEYLPVFDRILREPVLPTAVFAMNDTAAYAFIGFLESQGISVPEQMSVMGFDDIDRYTQRPRRLTTMRQPFDRIGQQAVDLLLRRLQSPGGFSRPYQHVYLSTQLVPRSTCRDLAAL